MILSKLFLVSVTKKLDQLSGTFWLNIADSYCGTGSKGACLDPKNPKGRNGQKVSLTQNVRGCKNKDMIGIPWMVAFALRDSGWYL